MAKPALGRGLGALLGGITSREPTAPASPTPAPAATPSWPTVVGNQERIQRIALKRIHPCPFQPRKDFSEEALRELADSIKEQGIVQPLIVRAKGNEFELIAGERRWRAAQLIGLSEVPVILKEADDRSVLELALIENLQRENLNPLEEALGYAQLIEQFQLTQEMAATKVGKSRAVVANGLRLLKLPAEIQNYIRDGRLSVGHAKVILGLTRSEDQKLAGQRILKDGLSVRQTEDLVARLQNRTAGSPETGSTRNSAPVVRDAHIADLETRLQERFGAKVQLRYRQGKGALEIRFFNDDDLSRVLEIVGIKLD
ncbi:MAG: ParB/RepB/Spo0J family partition protein [Verrucomicrobia bacterium]|nr:ParB/RepB/Spo0J family partition protein [Verrucomicrobiota bacterium]